MTVGLVHNITVGLSTIITLGRRQSKTPILSRNVGQKSIETLFILLPTRCDNVASSDLDPQC